MRLPDVRIILPNYKEAFYEESKQNSKRAQRGV